MASPYYTKQPVYLKEPSGRYQNILTNDKMYEDMPDWDANEKVLIQRNTPTIINFPFTPTISIVQSGNYQEYTITHSNFQQRAFDSHSNMELNMTAPMIVRSVEEADYVYNASLYIRSIMKMQWLKDDDPGMPPPIMRFYAHGIYENVPCIIRDFTWNLDSDLDYVEIPSGKNKGMRVPVHNMFVLSLATTYAPKEVREDFSVKEYLKGNLKDQGYV